MKHQPKTSGHGDSAHQANKPDGHQSANKQWWVILRTGWHGRGEMPEDLVKKVRDRILRIALECGDSPEHVEAAVTAIAKGYALVRAAARWQEPFAGPGNTVADRCRGEQWRLVMAWGGTETILGGLGALDKGKIQPVRVERILGNTGLDLLPEPVVPRRNLRRLERWLELGEGKERHPVLDYLGCRDKGAPTQAIRTWLVEGREIGRWSDAFTLARAFRHCSAHGALSASKVSEWGLRPCFEQLIKLLRRFSKTVMDRLASPEEE